MVARVRNRALTDKTVGDRFATMTRDELLQRLSDADIAFAEVNTMADLAVHPHLRRIEVDTPNGPVAYPAPAAIVVDQARHYGPVPAIGGRPSARPNPSAPGRKRHDAKNSISIICGNGSAAPRRKTDVVTAHLVRGLRATLFMDIGDPKPGDAAPFTAHWCLAQPVYPMSQLGPDGHPTRGGFLPPVPLPRRMWAGGELEFFDTLRVGDEMKRSSRISDVTMKTGSTGVLCFVSVQHEITTPRGVAIRERQDIVYRDVTTSAPLRRPSRPPPPPAQSTAKATWPTRCCCSAIRR